MIPQLGAVVEALLKQIHENVIYRGLLKLYTEVFIVSVRTNTRTPGSKGKSWFRFSASSVDLDRLSFPPEPAQCSATVGVIDALDNDSGVVDSVENGFKTPRRATASV